MNAIDRFYLFVGVLQVCDVFLRILRHYAHGQNTPQQRCTEEGRVLTHQVGRDSIVDNPTTEDQADATCAYQQDANEYHENTSSSNLLSS